MALSFLFESSIFWFLTIVYWLLAFFGWVEIALEGHMTWRALRMSVALIAALYAGAVASVVVLIQAFAE